ncbi:helix-turn-helix domain-containing protein [Brevundimonas sp.]|uniref:helix-turn-helix domain-containing protein n=1 Tax=Brevundimonas sp. TaxID=1871086 RepID=UPI0035AEE06D
MSAANDNGGKIAYSYKEAVAATGTSRNTLSKMVKAGEIVARHRGRRVFIPRAELERHFGPIDSAA